MAIIAFSHIKGGVGKTTLSSNVAVECRRRGCNTLLIDADPQQSAMAFATIRNDAWDSHLPCVALHGKQVRQQGVELAKSYDHTIIDCGAGDTTALRAALVMADAVVVPVQPRSLDLWPMRDLLDVIDEIRATRERDLPATSILNRTDPGSIDRGDNAEAVKMLQQFEGDGLAFSGVAITNLKIWAATFEEGLGVGEAPKMLGKAEQRQRAQEQLNDLVAYLFGGEFLTTEAAPTPARLPAVERHDDGDPSIMAMA